MKHQRIDPPVGVNELMMRRLQRALFYAGNTHTLSDILSEVHSGQMQSFCVGDSWAVTRILDTPRRRVLEIFMAVGMLDDMPELERQIEVFAKEHSVTLMRTFGRRGWLETGKSLGWKPRQTVFIKEI